MLIHRAAFSVLSLSLRAAAAAAQEVPKPAEQPAEPPRAAYEPHPVEVLRKEAAHLMPLMTCEDTKRFLIVTSWLPVVGPRAVYVDKVARKAITAAEYEKLPEADRAPFERRDLTESFYYTTRYGSPLAYARPLDILCATIGGPTPFREKKILDYGYGTIVHLRLLASIGAKVTGVEVDPLLKALYSEEGDTGVVAGAGMNDLPPEGHLKLVHGSWPGDEKVAAEAGGGFDIIMSKNTLKNGYINPEQEVDKRMLVDLGVEQQAYVEKVAAALNPGGLFMIYNICPAQKEKWIPWADGRCPFPREMLEAAGLEVLAYNADDTDFVKKMAQALEWDQGETPMDLENDLFAHYTLCRKKTAK